MTALDRLRHALANRHSYPWSTRRMQRCMMHDAIRQWVRAERQHRLASALEGALGV